MTIRPIARPKYFLLLSLAVSLLACDNSFRYRPREWQAVNEAVWSKTIGEVAIEHYGIGGLTGSRGVTPEFVIRNASERTLTVEHVELVTTTGKGDRTRLPSDAIEPRVVPPGASTRVTIFWKLPEPAIDRLGANPQIVVDFRLEDERQRLVIVYERGT